MLNPHEGHIRTERWRGAVKTIQQQRQQEATQVEELRQQVQDTKNVSALFQYIVSETNKANEEQTAELATLALKETFKDQDLTLKVEHECYRGQPGVSFKLRDEINQCEDDPFEAFGGGPSSLLGTILQVVSVVRQKKMARILILDEPLVQVSETYQEAAGKLLRKLCEPPPEGLGFKILLITHSERMANEAHKRYYAQRGDDGTLLLKEETNA